MVTVIEAHEVPRARITCPNCKSILEYGNADLMEDYRKSNPFSNSAYTPMYIRCPNCGVDVSANKIIPKEQ